jgi:xanthine dehydrogenase accessory factor
MRELLAELNRTLQADRPCVFCSVVETRGSTPQKAGAAMLVYPDGSQCGTLGGGCIEAEVRQRAFGVLSGADHRRNVLTFSLDDDYGWDDGLICGGRMCILADPLSDRQAAAQYYRSYQQIADAGKGCIETVVIGEGPSGLPIGSRCLFDADSRPLATLGIEDVPPLLAVQLPALGNRPGPSVRMGVAFLPLLPRVTLLIVGGGHVGQAVAQLANEVDFDIWVLDDRERFASQDRFPWARRILVGDIGALLRELARTEIGAGFFCIIVTRGHNHDEESLYHLVQSKAGYVGMIGSRRKIRMIFEDLQARAIPADALRRVHAPLGFAIGSQTVPEIAVSIVAELIACRNRGSTIATARTWVDPETTKP